MTTTMAKKPTKQGRSPAWVVNARLDPELESAYERYIAAQEYEPALRQVLERALKALFTASGHWPPKEEEQAD